jgi:hypothetical protein
VRSSRWVWLAAALSAAWLALALSGAALAAGSSITLRGPHVNKLGTEFAYTATGYANGGAAYAVGLEVSGGACARSYRLESRGRGAARVFRRSLKHNARFRLTVRIFASKVGSHRLCAYVTGRLGATTFARAEANWRNYPVGLEPAPLGGGECGARRFPDESVYAQVAVSNVECPMLESVAFGADGAKGAAYSRAGFSCTATAEGAGSTWANAWNGTYFAYTCTAGSELAAFTWGERYVYSQASALPLVKPGG